ncbi:MAG: tRNA pseudouridine(13) synthase TruD [Thaumarchaeota archaeon]|nr:tRNA pseudouridine(13) synthase TruD [Nitrososphaerota archaeon]
MIPTIDEKIGIFVYSTKFSGCRGIIKKNIDDFIVKEILSNKIKYLLTNNDYGYSLYKLKKWNMDTIHALNHISKRYKIRLKAIGLKDARAITEQYVCTINKTKIKENIKEKHYNLNPVCLLSKPLTKKYMIGNRFKIKISNSNSKLAKFEEYDEILNFFGYQRFGSKRLITHLIGKAILQKKFMKAIKILLSSTSKYDTKQNIEIRKKLDDESNYMKYINKIPSKMDLEKIILREMILHKNPLRSLRSLPLFIRRFFIQSYQSFLFNKTLSMATKNNEVYKPLENDVCFDEEFKLCKFSSVSNNIRHKLAVPIIGFTYYKKTRFHQYINKILNDERISPKDFFINDMQESSNEGGFRHALINYDDLYVNDNIIKFTLNRGCFATIVLREIIKPDDPIKSGF